MPKKRDHGQGGLYSYKRKVTLKDGTVRTHTYWRGVVDVGFDAEGKRDQRTVTAKTQREAKAKLDKLLDEIREFGEPLAKRATLGPWATKWLDTIAKPSVDPKTFASYRSNVNKWIVPTLGTKAIASLKPSDVRTLRDAMKKAGRSTSTIRGVQVVLSLILDAAVAERLCRRNVCEDVKKPGGKRAVVKTDRGALATEQVIAILKVASTMPDGAGSRWWFKILSGQRQGEIIGATLEDLDLDARTYAVNWKLEALVREHGCRDEAGAITCDYKRGANCPKAEWVIPDDFEKRQIDGAWHLTRPKSKTGRVVPLIPQLAEAIRRYLDATKDWPNPHGLIWRNKDGSPVLPKDDGQQWRDLLQAAGVITAEENKPKGTALTGHWTRHTAVTVLASLKVDFQLIGEIVGHSTAQVTALYRHAQEEEKRAAMQALAGAWADALGPVVEPGGTAQIEA